MTGFSTEKCILALLDSCLYEACLIIPLQTLLIDCTCLLKTQTQVLQWWDKNLCIIKCSEHQLWLLKYTISEMNTQYDHSEIIIHDITLKTITCMYWTKKKKKSWYCSTTLAHKNKCKSQSKAIITAAHLN